MDTDGSTSRYLTRLPGPIRLCKDLRIRHGHPSIVILHTGARHRNILAGPRQAKNATRANRSAKTFQLQKYFGRVSNSDKGGPKS